MVTAYTALLRRSESPHCSMTGQVQNDIWAISYHIWFMIAYITCRMWHALCNFSAKHFEEIFKQACNICTVANQKLYYKYYYGNSSQQKYHSIFLIWFSKRPFSECCSIFQICIRKTVCRTSCRIRRFWCTSSYSRSRTWASVQTIVHCWCFNTSWDRSFLCWIVMIDFKISKIPWKLGQKSW